MGRDMTLRIRSQLGNERSQKLATCRPCVKRLESKLCKKSDVYRKKMQRVAKKNCLGVASPRCGRGLMSLCVAMHFVLRKSTIGAHMHSGDSHGMSAQLSSLVSAPYIDHYLLYATPTFQTVSSFGGYVRHVMSVTLPKLLKLMSNENHRSKCYEMQSFMKSNVPAIMTHEHQSLAAIESEQYAIEYEAQFQRQRPCYVRHTLVFGLSKPC